MRISDWMSDVCSSDLKAGSLAFRQVCDPQPDAAGRPSGRNQGGGIRRRRMPGDIRPEGLPAASGPSGRDGACNRTSPSTLFATLVDAGRVIGPAFSTRSEEHPSELQSLMRISYAVFCLKKKIYTNSNLLCITPAYY